MPEIGKRAVAWNKFLYNRTEAAVLLGTSRTLVLRCLREHQLDTRSVGGQVLITRVSLAKLYKTLHDTDPPIPPPGRDVPQPQDTAA